MQRQEHTYIATH